LAEKPEKSEKQMKKGGPTPYGECTLPEEGDFPLFKFSAGQV
jgi:hypothetical protein